MTYAKKLLIAKILVSLGLGLIMFGSLWVYATSGPPDWTVRGQFPLASTAFGSVLALPIMLYAVWSKTLFGTGRSVRLMAYLGLASVLGVFLAGASRPHLAEEYYASGQQILVMGINANIFMNSLIFIILLLGVLFSIKGSADNN